MKRLAVVLILASSAMAQNAKVIQLKPEDAAEAKHLYAEKAEVDSRIASFREQVAQDYLMPQEMCLTEKCTYIGLDVWANGIEFSEDFRFIVPKPWPAATFSGSCGMAVPAGGNK